MIYITSEELEDYCTCPDLYEKKYITKETPVRDKTSSHFDGHSYIVSEAKKAINELVGYYFHRLMDNRQIRYKTLYKKWEDKWWANYSGNDIMDLIIPVSRSNRVRINTSFINHLPKFYGTFHKPFKPLIVDREVKFPAHECVVTSKIQMAYKLSNGMTRIVKFVPYRIAPNKPENDLDLIVQAHGWMYEFEEDEVEIAYYCMLTPNNYSPFTTRTINKNSSKNLARIMKAFKDKEIIKSVSCSGCEYKCEVK